MNEITQSLTHSLAYSLTINLSINQSTNRMAYTHFKCEPVPFHQGGMIISVCAVISCQTGLIFVTDGTLSILHKTYIINISSHATC